MTRVGVLALQGDVREHSRMLVRLGADVVLVRRPEELEAVSGVILPGGESGVIDKLAREFGLRLPICAAIARGLPVYGTCAGLILLADRIANPSPGQQSFGGLDITVERNAFGRQAESFETDLQVQGMERAVHAAFIRAPVVVERGPDVRAIATLPDGRVVAVRQENLLGTAFHPEATGETGFHELFLEMIAARTDGVDSVRV
ncbi:pyridoxal 5'-phosphate synthase glutaminase subunit PdxT [Microbacterium dextranolyticum]|uniref:pyridoxal 5'-phosphate synthase glutaminase subunit PdxT n=1 Tax=Microbacterium dextranolyticum TaxID=36806 RepID=UPI00195A082E|nr:pyridoxal 5'-phosphate synthase glutaminase subunit PdxT [Microbacterium dextranolyticum]MBM7463018.1 5'-phosphate synthase pdxT subunit [Microbacterium dextranolyticum]